MGPKNTTNIILKKTNIHVIYSFIINRKYPEIDSVCTFFPIISSFDSIIFGLCCRSRLFYRVENLANPALHRWICVAACNPIPSALDTRMTQLTWMGRTPSNSNSICHQMLDPLRSSRAGKPAPCASTLFPNCIAGQRFHCIEMGKWSDRTVVPFHHLAHQ